MLGSHYFCGYMGDEAGSGELLSCAHCFGLRSELQHIEEERNTLVETQKLLGDPSTFGPANIKVRSHHSLRQSLAND